MALRTVGVKLAAEVSSYVGGLRTAKTATKDFVGELDKAAKAGQLDAVADQAGRMGLALGAAFAGVVAVTARFDKQMSEVGAVANASAADLDRLREAALQAGKDTAFSATEAAKAQAELAKAGLSTSQILGGALAGSLSLAAAGSLDLAESADIAAKTMNVFQLEGKDVGHIADVLAAAANKSATDVHEMGEALRMGGLAANSAGMSLEETVGTLSAFADRALVGSDAGTSLKTMLQMLAAPSEKAANLMEQLGIHAYDLQGNFIGTTKLAANLERAFGGLTQEQRNAAMATIFGADAMRAANVLFEVGEQGIKDYTAAVDDQGAAADVAAKKMDNLAGDVEKLKGSLETMAIEAGSGSASGLRVIVQTADNLVASLSSMPGPLQTAAVALAGVGGAALLATAGMIKMKSAVAPALEELAAMGPQGARAARGLEATSKWAGRVGVALVALQVAGAVASTFRDDLNPQIDALVGGLKEWNRQTELAGEAARVFGGDADELSKALSATANNGFSQAMDGVTDFIFGIGGMESPLDTAKQRVVAFDQALAAMARDGNAEAAGRIVEEMARRSNTSIENVLKVLPTYSAELENAARAAGEAGTASGSATGGINAVGAAAADSAQRVQELKDAFDRLFGIQMDLDRAVIAYKQGLAELNEELRTGKRTLDDNTQAGRDNASALLDQVDNIKDLRQANIDNGMSMEDANTTYQNQINQLVALGIKLGYDERQIRNLIGAYADIPEKVDTKVSAPGADASKKKANDLNFAIRALPNTWQTILKVADETAKREIANYKRQLASISRTITTNFNAGTVYHGQRWGGVTVHAQEGALRQANVYSPAGAARYAFAEPATGGEAFIPRRGDRARSLGILDTAAGWYGMEVGRTTDWSGYKPMTPQTIAPPIRVETSSHFPTQEVARELGRELTRVLSGATFQLDDRTARLADLLVRGG